MIKKIIKSIPLISRLAVSVKRKLRKPFTTSENYWNERYKKGGNSGAGSYNKLAEFKAEVINEFVNANNISTVIEFGCGDGNQLKLFRFDSYIGYDVSPAAISICNEIFKNDTSKQFKLLQNNPNESADLTMSLDVIYHLVEDDTYFSYMKKLFSSSNKYVIVYSSNTKENDNDGVVFHVRHREFTGWVEKNIPEFELIEHIPNRYPYNGDGQNTSCADFYIYKRRIE